MRAEVALALALVVGPGLARAADDPAPSGDPSGGPSGDKAPEDDVAALNREAAEAYADARFAEAAALWRRVRAALPAERAWKVDYNLGLAFDEAGRPTEAAEHLGAFLQRVAAETSALPAAFEQRREDAAARLSALRAAYLRVELGDADGVTASVDDAAPAPVGRTLYLPPGPHRVKLYGPDGRQREVEVEGDAGQTRSVDTRFDVRVPEPVVVEKREVVVQGPSFPTVWVATGAALTAVSFVLPGVLFAQADSRRGDAEALGPGHTGYESAVDDFEGARTAYLVSYALPAALGLATLTVATVGWVQIASTPQPSKEGPSAALGLGPGSLSLHGRF